LVTGPRLCKVGSGRERVVHGSMLVIV